MANTPGYRIPNIIEADRGVVDTTSAAFFRRNIAVRAPEADRLVPLPGRAPALSPPIFRQSEDGRIPTIRDAGERNDRGRLRCRPLKQTGNGTGDSDELGELVLASPPTRADRVTEERGQLPVR
jgi:hypothetical protein